MDPSLVYAHLRTTHITLVLVSGALFALRGLGVLRAHTWPMAPGVRRLSYGIDTALLLAAVGLLQILHLNPLVEPWLQVKLLALLAYIVLGSFALKRARSPRARLVYLVAALACYGLMLVTARTHDPWGFLRLLPLG